jgi:hypothetical protein
MTDKKTDPPPLAPGDDGEDERIPVGSDDGIDIRPGFYDD